MQDIFIGRQPVYNHQLGIIAYELLFRNSAGAIGDFDREAATSQVILNAFNEIGIDRIAGDRKVVINVTAAFLDRDEQLPVDPERVILDLPRGLFVTAARLEQVARLRSRGYTIALDDFILTSENKGLVALADIIKIDTGPMRRADLEKDVRTLRRFGKPLLAESVETMDDYAALSDLGFQYYQGYFLSKPRIVKSQALPANRLTVMQLLTVLHNPDSDMREVEAAINQDVTLGYKLLKLMNSAFFGLTRQIDSVGRAVLLLGRKKLSSWASMLALTSLSEKPVAAVGLAMTRAKMAELLAEAIGTKETDPYFTVGLFSALDVLMDRALETLIQPLPLTDEIKAAILKHEGRVGQALACVTAYEQGEWEQVRFAGLTQGQITQAYLDADAWSQQVLGSLVS